MIKRGEIRKPKRNAKIIKVLAPPSVNFDFDETQGEFQVFIPIKEVDFHIMS
jgi:hypothetical protein